MARNKGPNATGGARPRFNPRSRAESLLDGVPIGPRIRWRRPAVVPEGAIGVQPWGVLPAKPPARKAADE